MPIVFVEVDFIESSLGVGFLTYITGDLDRFDALIH